MRRTEPPPLATWILEHGIPGDYDEALAGDLLEDFRSGRSDGWFWRQALAACAVSWGQSLRARIPLLVFALLWSIPAPAWKVYTDSVRNAPVFARIWPLFGPGWVVLAFVLWLALNAAFLCAGVFIFLLSQSSFAQIVRGGKLSRALLLVVLLFLPIYAATFVFVSLYWYSFFATAPLAPAPVSEIADLRLFADVARVPCLAALLGALWNEIPPVQYVSRPALADASPLAPSTPSGSSTAPVAPHPFAVQRFFAFMVGAGLLNALIAGFLLCRLPDSHTPSLQSLVARAAIYVAIGALAGMVGVYLYWYNPASPFRAASPLPFSLFALACAAGWIWVPSMVIFSEQLSAVTALVGGIGAFFLAAGLRHATSFVLAAKPRAPSPANSEDFELFAESLYRPPREAHGYVIALCLYAAGWALATRSNSTACTLLALSAFLFAWKRTFAPSHDLDTRREYKRAALRLALIFIPAVLVTIWALIDGVAHRNYLAAVNAARSTSEAASADEDADQQTKSPPSATGFSGYQSVILWPVPEKKQILPPFPQQTSLLAPETTKPLIIKFDGPYWYFQPPRKGPGPRALQVRGTPLIHDFQTNNFISLIMEAHQTLGTSIPLARCREIQVGILNRDNRRGIINLAILLTDSSSPGKPQLYLGQQPVASSLPANFAVKLTPAGETLRFSIPSPSRIRKFDEITVMFFPDASNYDVGPKVAIDQFQLIPR